VPRKNLPIRIVLAIVLIALCLSACSSYGSGSATDRRSDAARLSEEQKHRLYSAALAASESPLESDDFKEVCKRIGIFDGDGKPNNNYMAFVSEHVDWGMKSETAQFRQEINSKEKAKEYLSGHLPR